MKLASEIKKWGVISFKISNDIYKDYFNSLTDKRLLKNNEEGLRGWKK